MRSLTKYPAAVLRATVTAVVTTALACAPVVVLAPVAHAVAPDVQHIPLAGVDSTALAELNSSRSSASLDSDGHQVTRAGEQTVALTPQRPADPFTLVAVTWDDPDSTDAQVQARVRENGTWSAWYPLSQESADDADGPDPGSAEAERSRGGSAPLLTGGADGYQVRVDSTDGKTPAGLRVELVDAGSSAADATLGATPSATADATGTRPAIITRAQWGADESLRTAAPEYSNQLRVGVVHHTESTNNYTAAGAAAQVRAIYAFHTKSRGWSDIGYNFLLDKYGRIFEGRAGGVDRAVIGAHAGGYNSNTFGVSVLGSYTSGAVPKAVISGLTDVLAWKFATNHIDPYGRSLLTSAGGGTARYAAGDTRYFNNLIGHRDTGTTACPGASLYGMLSILKASVRAKMTSTTGGIGGSSLGSRLSSGQSMTESSYLRSANTEHVLTANGFAGDQYGLVLTGPSCTPVVLNSLGKPAVGRRWSTKLSMQSDGNLVLYADGKARWYTRTQGNSGAYAVLQNDRNLVVYSRSGKALWSSRSVCAQARVGAVARLTLSAGMYLASPDRRSRLVMQSDGNLVLYTANRVRWSSGTSGRNGAYLAVQSDGNLVIYSGSRAVWSSRTGNSYLTDLSLQNDGNLVLYAHSPGRRAAWSTGT